MLVNVLMVLGFGAVYLIVGFITVLITSALFRFPGSNDNSLVAIWTWPLCVFMVIVLAVSVLFGRIAEFIAPTGKNG